MLIGKGKAATLGIPQAGYERAAQDCEQAARDEVHVAVAQDIEMSGAEMRENAVLSKMNGSKSGLPIKFCYLKDMNSVAGDALENERRSLLNEATAKLQRHQGQNQEHLQ